MSHNISFIIPCFNCEETLDETMVSIIETNLEHGDEIILIDDASTDGTLEKLYSYRDRYDFVKVVRHTINKGNAAAGRNTGIDQAKNELLFCLDADNILKPNSIKGLKAYLIANELDAAAFGALDYFRDNVSNVTHTWTCHQKLSFLGALNDYSTAPCSSGNYLMTKAIWKKAGRCNEFLGGAYDSDLFSLKILAEGAKFWTLPGTAYLHRYGYESTYMRDYTKKNTSLLYLAGLMNYLHLIDERDVDYMFGKGRLTWKEDISKRPIRPRRAVAKETGFLKKVLNKALSLF